MRKSLLHTPWYYGWTIVAAGMASQAVTIGLLIYSFTFWVEPWSKDFGVGRTEVMTVFLVFQVFNALFAPIAGRALDSFPVRNLMLVGGMSLSAALALSAVATSILQIGLIYAVLVVIGMGWAGTIPAATLVSRWFGKRRGMAMGISTIGTSIGGFLLPPLVASWQQEYGWRDASLMLAVLSLVVIGLAAMFMVNSPQDAGIPHEGQAAGPAAGSEPQSAREWTVHDALRSRVFWAIGISFLLMSFSITGVQQNLAPIGADAGMEPTKVALYMSSMAFVMIFAKLGFGYLADRVDYRLLLGFAILLVASTLAILTFFGSSEAALLIAVIALGIGMGGMLPMLGVIVADIFGQRSFGRMQGLLILVMLPSALGPVMAAGIFDASGSYQWAWYIFLGLMVPTGIFIRGITATGEKRS